MPSLHGRVDQGALGSLRARIKRPLEFLAYIGPDEILMRAIFAGFERREERQQLVPPVQFDQFVDQVVVVEKVFAVLEHRAAVVRRLHQVEHAV